MIRLLLVILMPLMAVSAPAINHWYGTPVQMPAGLTVIDVAEGMPQQLVAHGRCAVDRRHGGSWGLAWDIADSLNLTRAVIMLPERDVHDELGLSKGVLTVETLVDGRVVDSQSITLSSHIDCDGRFNSVKLTYAGGVALLSVGADQEGASLVVPFSGRSSAVALYAVQPVKCQRLQNESVPSSVAAVSRFADYESLLAHIRGSSDPMEGFWRYLDRDVDSSKASLGGAYTLATVRDGDGYDIIYIDGAQTDPHRWSRMCLKGRLRPTPFVGNYDMEWYTSSHRLLDAETNAQLSDDHSILTCRFPLLGSSFRFARLPLSAF